jgi:hypothetical protein
MIENKFIEFKKKSFFKIISKIFLAQAMVDNRSKLGKYWNDVHSFQFLNINLSFNNSLSSNLNSL